MQRRTSVLLALLAALIPVYLWMPGRRGPAGGVREALPMSAPTGLSLPDLEVQVRAQPVDAVLRTRLGAAYARRGRFEPARRQLERAVILDGQLPEARHNLGLIYLKTFQLDRALDQLTRELELRPGDAQVHLALGMTCFSLREAAPAVRHLRLAARLDPGNTEIELWLARALYLAGDVEGCERSLKRVTTRLPDPAYGWYLLGRVYASRQRYPEALAAAREAVARAPAQPYHHLFLGQVCLELRQIDESIGACGRALALDPDLVAAHAQLGRALVLAQRFPEALPHLRRALQRNPDDPTARSDLAATYAALGRPAEAAKEFAWVRARRRSEANLKMMRKRAELQPRRGESWYQLGRACARAGRQRDAEAALVTALQVQPGHAASRRLLATLHRDSSMSSEFDAGP